MAEKQGGPLPYRLGWQSGVRFAWFDRTLPCALNAQSMQRTGALWNLQWGTRDSQSDMLETAFDSLKLSRHITYLVICVGLFSNPLRNGAFLDVVFKNERV